VQGRHVYFQADPACPIHEELRGLATKTSGVVGLLREALEPLTSRIRVAFVFGSVARGDARRASDVDLLVIGKATLREVVAALRGVEKSSRREVNPVVYPPAEARTRAVEARHLLAAALRGPKVFVLGSEDELARVLA
jgi:predicted nucleotidyltransferase